MNPFRQFRAWCRLPNVQPWLAALLWLMTMMNVLWGVQDFREGYDVRTKTQAARMRCEAKGGLYGSAVGASNRSDTCVEPVAETALADRRSR